MSFENQNTTSDANAIAEASFFIPALESPAPTDDFTGLPLPILPVWDYSGSFHDQHHAFFSSHVSPLAGESGRVLRHSRLQYGPRQSHARYHGFFDGVPLPTNPNARFGMAVLACAGFIPESAVDVRKGKPKIVQLTDDDRRYLQDEGLIYTEKRMSSTTGRDTNNIKRGIYFMKYALSQELDHLKHSMLEEFIETDSSERRLKLGMFIVDKAFSRAVEPVEDLYVTAHKHGYIHPAQQRHPVSFLRLVVSGHQRYYLDELEKQITAVA